MKENEKITGKFIHGLKVVQKILDSHSSEKISQQNIIDLITVLEGIHDSEEKLRNLQDNVPIGLFQSTPDGKLIYANNWLIKLFRYEDISELYRKNLFELYIDPEQRTKLVGMLNKNGKIDNAEVLLRRNDGTEMWGVISAKTVYDDDRNVKNYDGYVYDISQRKIVLEQLKESETMFRALSDNLKSALYIFNNEGKFIYINPATSEITGYSQEEFLKKRFFDIIHPDFQELVKKRGFDRISGKKVPQSYEIKIITKQGEEKWLELFSTRLELNGESVVMGLGIDINAQKKSLETIKRSEQNYKSLYSLFRLMADNVPDMMWAKDLDRNFIFVNKGMCDKLLNAASIEEPIGKNEMYFVERERQRHPDSNDWYTFGEDSPGSDEVVMRTKKPHRFEEYGYVMGKFIFLNVYKAPLWDDDGKMIGIVGSARDITEEINIRNEKAREEKIKNVVYNISNAVSTTRDLNELFTVIRIELDKVIDTSNFFIAMYDKKEDKITLPYFVDEKDRFVEFPEGPTLTQYLINVNKPLLLRENDLKKLAEDKVIEIHGSMAKVWLGVPLNCKEHTIGAIVLQNYTNESAFNYADLKLVNYVSNQICISINQKKFDDAVKESEFRLRQIIDTVPHMIFAKDKDSRFILANKATAEAYGLRVDQIEGKLQKDIHRNQEEFEKIKKDDLFVFETRNTKIVKEQLFTDCMNNQKILNTIKIPLIPGAGNETTILGVAIDVTENKNTEIALKLAKEKAEESDKLKTAYLANMSHEIRTPMNAIVGFSELLNDDDLDTGTRTEFIRLIRENSKLLLGLIEDIIDVAKIEAEQIKIINSTCQVNQILDELHKSCVKELDRFHKSGLEIRLSKANTDERFAIISDPLRFKQILNNLLSNALKFTDKGIVEFGYTIENENEIRFFVKDTGIGLPPDKLDLIFERFRQAEESSTKEYGGAGLGLTISKRLVELLGGKLWVESVYNEGSSFYFSLPIRTTQGALMPKPLVPDSDHYNWTGKTILVAEDETSNFELVKAVLLKTGVKLIWVKNGKDAVDMCKKDEGIDLVLMDIRMPELNGYEATMLIKKIRRDLPVISQTAYAMANDREKSLQAGCDDYISKPIKPNELLRKIGLMFAGS
ncbi:MAG: PAS domain S-box protein [Bacteroidales bacterium]